MKILFLTENFPPETNAAATRVFERACYWAKWGHDVTVITCAPNFPGGRLFAGYENRWRQTEEMAGIKVVRVKTYIAANRGIALRTLDFLSFMVTGFAAGIGQPRPDVVAATSPQFFSAVAGWAVGAIRRVPFVFELGDLWPASIAAVGAMGRNPALRAVEALELFLYRRSAAVAALTRSFKDDLVSRGIKGDKIAVVINGVDLPRYEPRVRDEALAAEWGLSGKTVVGYVGTHGMAHALSNVLDAAERVRDLPNVRFVLVGGGAERDALIADAARRNLDNVVFIPPQPKERMPAVWSLCDVALVHLKDSSVFAGVIPSKIFEAMGMGLPVLLAAPAGEASRIVTTSKAGLHVAAQDADALANAVRNLSENTDLRKSLAGNSLAAAPLYSRERQAREMIEVLELAASGKGGEAGLRIKGVG
ncbi:MAG: glycosyltransferase family 4 protein [Rhodospirillales bacterium]|nr:glycosyltransferase family 4 protein [Rhodospirillales bacterium]